MTDPVRFRSLGRDMKVDLDRLGPLFHQFDRVLAGIERERDGLSRRLDEARTRAAALMGNEDGIYFEREPANEAGLVEAEAQMMAAYGRLDRLNVQRGMIATWRDELNRAGIPNMHSGVLRQLLRYPRTALVRDMGAIRRLGRYFGWALLAAIAYATLAGIEQRPIVAGLLPDIERSLAFLATAVAFAVGYPRQRLLAFGAGLAAIASLEIAQGWTPARHGTVQDALIKAAGLSLGFFLVTLMERYGRPSRFS